MPDQTKQQSSPTTSTDKRERLLAWAGKWRVVLEILVPSVVNALILIVIIVHAVIYRSQWKVMVEQQHLMRESVDESKKTREIENAAYVGIKAAKLKEPIDFGHIQHAQLIFENTGSTPALNGRVAARIQIRNSAVPEPMPLPTFKPNEQTVFVLPRGAEYTMDKTQPS